MDFLQSVKRDCPDCPVILLTANDTDGCLLYTSYSKKIQGRKQVGGQSTHIPLKVNTSGVIPVIFAQSLLQTDVYKRQVHNIELYAGKGGQLVRSAGMAAQLMAKEGKYATLRLSLIHIFFPIFCNPHILNYLSISSYNIKLQLFT